MEKLNLVFASTAGDYEETFQSDRLLKDVKLEVMRKLNLDPTKAEEFIVTFKGNPLDENKKLHELHLEDGAVVVIERKEVTKI